VNGTRLIRIGWPPSPLSGEGSKVRRRREQRVATQTLERSDLRIQRDVLNEHAYAMSGGRRDFSSARAIRANTYSVLVDTECAGQARQLLGGQER
jgi:hypothetical protein